MGRLLNLPALFALADFHLFSVIYAALGCAAMSTFAGYSAPRVHQEFVIAILARTGLLAPE
jgi:nucleoside permease NupC